MPVIEKTKWQPAHFEKVYLKPNSNELIKNDKDLIILNNSFEIITKENLLSPTRLNEIIRHHIGYYNNNLKSIKNRYRTKNLFNCSFSLFKCNY